MTAMMSAVARSPHLNCHVWFTNQVMAWACRSSMLTSTAWFGDYIDGLIGVSSDVRRTFTTTCRTWHITGGSVTITIWCLDWIIPISTIISVFFSFIGIICNDRPHKCSLERSVWWNAWHINFFIQYIESSQTYTALCLGIQYSLVSNNQGRSQWAVQQSHHSHCMLYHLMLKVLSMIGWLCIGSLWLLCGLWEVFVDFLGFWQVDFHAVSLLCIFITGANSLLGALLYFPIVRKRWHGFTWSILW